MGFCSFNYRTSTPEESWERPDPALRGPLVFPGADWAGL